MHGQKNTNLNNQLNFYGYFFILFIVCLSLVLIPMVYTGG